MPRVRLRAICYRVKPCDDDASTGALSYLAPSTPRYTKGNGSHPVPSGINSGRLLPCLTT